MSRLTPHGVYKLPDATLVVAAPAQRHGSSRWLLSSLQAWRRGEPAEYTVDEAGQVLHGYLPTGWTVDDLVHLRAFPLPPRDAGGLRDTT